MEEITNPHYHKRGETQTGPADKASNTAASSSLVSAEQPVEKVLTILPKGFVENTAEIYAEVASYDVLTPEKLKEYWRVYTTTNRRLCDPTAKRLESFWWHVWGSKLRHSSGKTLAKLYENISTGPTFVPLRGPANRYEGPQSQPTKQPPKDTVVQENSDELGPADLSHTSGDAANKDRDRACDGVTTDRNGNAAAEHAEVTQCSVATASDEDTQPQAPVKVLSSSASRPPPAQSILKKSRPSMSGSRPSPRFTLPVDLPTQGGPDNHTSAGMAEIVVSSSLASGSESASSGLAVEPALSSAGSSKSGSRLPGGHKQARAKQTKKKFVATSSKRKALVLKRSGSQVLSAASDGTGQKEARGSQSPQKTLDEQFESRETEHTTMLPPKHEPLVLSLTPEDEQAELQPIQQLQPLQPPQLPQPPQPPQLPQSPQSLQPLQSPQSPPVLQTHAQGIPVLVKSDAGTADIQTAQQDPEGPTSAHSAAARLERIQNSNSPLANMLSILPSDTRPRRRGPSTVAPPLLRGYSSMDITVRSRELLGNPSSRLLRHMPLPQEIRRPPAPRSAAMSSPAPSTSVETAAGTSSRPSTPNSGSSTAPPLVRSTSEDGSECWIRRGSATVASPSAAVATASMVAARGVFSEADGPDPFQMYAATGLSGPMEDDEDEDKQQSPSFHLERSSFSYTDPNPVHRPMFTPTRPTPTPRIPFARTRSQLNVILDRERTRLGEDNFASWQESRSGRDTPRTAEGSDPLRSSEALTQGSDNMTGSTVP